MREDSLIAIPTVRRVSIAERVPTLGQNPYDQALFAKRELERKAANPPRSPKKVGRSLP